MLTYLRYRLKIIEMTEPEIDDIFIGNKANKDAFKVQHALDTLGIKITEENLTWTKKERSAYEEATRILKRMLSQTLHLENADFAGAEEWLFREYLEKLKKNNVKRVFVVTEDGYETQRFYSHNFISDSYVKKSIEELLY